MLRRPLGTVARTVAVALRDEPAAVADALRHLPWTLRHRRRLPTSVEDALRELSRPHPRVGRA
jgi:N-acetylglucosaminyl-diphospho-decaprenol L-rhamnosyltransferase